MSRVDKWTLAAVLVFFGVVCPYLVWLDFQHPEKWIPGTGDDPHIYLWAWAGVAVLWLYIAWRIFCCERDRKRRTRLAALLIQAEELVRQHRRDEATAVLKECQTLYDKLKTA